jgi:hypothetical protein
MSIKRGVAGGTIGTAIASICCLVPLLLLTAGVGVAASLVVSPYRPYFIMLGTAFVGLYIFLNIMGKASGCSSSFKEMFRSEKNFVFTTIATFAAGLLLVNLVVLPALGSEVTGKVAAKEYEASSLRGVEFKIAGMTCTSCADVLEDLLMKKEGVTSAYISYKKKGVRA